MLTEVSGHAPIEVPCDREGPFEPQIVKRLERRLHGVDELVVMSPDAKTLEAGEISPTPRVGKGPFAFSRNLRRLLGLEKSLSRITDKVLDRYVRRSGAGSGTGGAATRLRAAPLGEDPLPPSWRMNVAAVVAPSKPELWAGGEARRTRN